MIIMDLTLDDFINTSDSDIERADIVTVDGIEIKSKYFSIDTIRYLKLFEIRSIHDIVISSDKKLRKYLIDKVPNIGILKTQPCLRPDVVKRKNNTVYIERDRKTNDIKYFQIEWEYNNKTYFQIILSDGKEEWRECY